ncbi:MAG: ABC transporter permease [Acidobacteria bacterium]|nr:ABC transporter permease [Acidobacteriota bacterium]
MSLTDLMRFAGGALSGHRLRTGLSMLGVAIGIAAVIMLTALGEGARLYVINQFASLGTNLLIVLPGRVETTGGFPGFGGVPNDLTIDDAEALRSQVQQARHVVPLSMGVETVSYGEKSRQVPVMGSTHELLVTRDLKMGSGRFLPAGDWDRGSPVAVLGPKLAAELFGRQSPIGQVVRIGEWRMRVIGVLGRQGVRLGVDFDDMAVVPVATGMRMLNRSSLFRVLLKVNSHEEIEAAKSRVLEIMIERHDEEDVTLITQDAVISTFSAIIGVLTLALGGIAAISLTVAGIGIMNVMLVSVSERTEEIGLLKALGVRSRQILAVFLAEALLLSSLGGLAGLAGGWGAVYLAVRLWPVVPAAPPAWAVLAALGISVGVGVLFGVLPARRATRLDPVASLARR